MRGFTIFETLIVLALVSIGLVMSVVEVTSLTRAQNRNETEIVVEMLRRARADTLQGACAESCAHPPSHGVIYINNSFVRFEGSSYVDRTNDGERVNQEQDFHVEGLTEIVFSAQDGGVLNPGSMHLVYPDHMDTIFINSEGGIRVNE
ncbi:MAG: hypothetical protein JWN64_104 [Parcubacteria group bacterium]|nr:hypothetical protein [Parcubacteria group bacterium]